MLLGFLIGVVTGAVGVFLLVIYGLQDGPNERARTKPTALQATDRTQTGGR